SQVEGGAILTIGAEDGEAVEISLQLSAPLPERVLQCLPGARTPSDRFGECIKLYLALKTADAHGWTYSAANESPGFRFVLRAPKSARQRLNAAMNSTVEMLVEFTAELLGVNTCSLMLSDELTGDLAIRAAKGLSEDIIRRTRIRYGDRIAGWVAQEGKPLLIDNIETDSRFGRPNLQRQYASKSLMSLPLKIGGEVVGVINLNNRKDGGNFTPRDLRLARVVSERVSTFIQNLQSQAVAEQAIGSTLAALGTLIGALKQEQRIGCRRSELIDQLLERLGAAEEERDIALYVAMVYDLGLIPLDARVLGKKGKLSLAEIDAVRSHPLTSIDLLGEVEFSAQVRTIIRHHHERFDGSGYPDGLRGDEIPLVSRVLAVVDTFCAMTEARPHRLAMSAAEALAEIRRGEGRFYHPRAVAALLEIIAPAPVLEERS
ncbi:MAG: GAF domain-containing protein, partial [Desulfuromonadales bacterium]|nr:GAF domain-containing protein [Desulfuromonadales bacterium]